MTSSDPALKEININRIQWNQEKGILKRPANEKKEERTVQVREIINSVRNGGDAALIQLTLQLDRVEIGNLRVSAEEIQRAYQEVKEDVQCALREAIRRVTLFHTAQLPRPIDLETSPGVRCERRYLPIRQVGLYIPAGTAPLPSAAVMMGVPSQIAGCTRRVLMTPPRGGASCSVDPTILVVADMLGISEIYKIGGAQAIAAMAYGTETIQKVDKIFGPGNSWVTEAKLQVSQDPQGAACDLPAGPSEVMVIADENANAEFVASDLLSQAEHGPDSQVILVSTSAQKTETILQALSRQLERLPRKSVAAECLSKSLIIEITDIRDAFEICNEYAPEHLILQIENPRDYLDLIQNAGSIFLGPWSPESVGDYASGTNHVLPTYGFAKAYGGLTTESFMKSVTIQELSPSGLMELGPVVMKLAETEMLMAHRNAVAIRLAELKTSPREPAPIEVQDVMGLARPSVLNMKAYQSARSLNQSGRIFLDANESPSFDNSDDFGNSRELRPREASGLNRYPDPQPKVLKERLSELYRVPGEQIMIGRGADEAIDLLVRVFCEAGKDQIVICPPTYGMYEVSAQIQGAGVCRVPLLAIQEGGKNDFQLDLEGLSQRFSPQSKYDQKNIKLVFICAPNNPTGSPISLESILAVCEMASGRALVVVDEAYVEFNVKSDGTVSSLIPEISRVPNLVVLRTLSKAWGMAGARCGVAIAQESVIQLLQKVRAPYPLSQPTLHAVMAGIDKTQESALRDRVAVICREKERLVGCLLTLKLVEKVYESSANFVLVKFRDSKRMMQATREQGIVLRDRSSEIGLAGCIRITIGSERENDALIAILKTEATR